MWAAESSKGPVIGKIAARSSKAIAASPLGIGFETLDRRFFDPEKTYEPLEKLGIKWARVQTGWSRCETTKGKYDFTWQGECGCPSAANSGGALAKNHWDETQQARWLLRRVLNDLRLKVEHVSWYNVADQLNYASGWRKQQPQSGKPEITTVDYGTGAQETTRNNLYFGLLRVPGYNPKPSYFAYQNLCALFDSQTETADIPMQFAGDFAESEPAVSVDKIEQAAFVRAGCPLVAYWFPIAVQENMPTQAVDVTIAVGNDLPLRKPVLVNPLNGEVSKLEGKQSAGQWEFTALPLTDYPMLITDAAVAGIDLPTAAAVEE